MTMTSPIPYQHAIEAAVRAKDPTAAAPLPVRPVARNPAAEAQVAEIMGKLKLNRFGEPIEQPPPAKERNGRGGQAMKSMKWMLVIGGVLAAAWFVLSLRPVDLMTPECRTLVEKTKTDNDALRRDLDLAQRGLLRIQANLLEQRQAVIKDNLKFIEQFCKRRAA